MRVQILANIRQIANFATFNTRKQKCPEGKHFPSRYSHHSVFIIIIFWINMWTAKFQRNFNDHKI